jgi:hypothetical protein
LDQPHSADVRAVEQSEFHIADALHCWPTIRPSPSTSRRSWPGVSTAPTRL